MIWDSKRSANKKCELQRGWTYVLDSLRHNGGQWHWRLWSFLQHRQVHHGRALPHTHITHFNCDSLDSKHLELNFLQLSHNITIDERLSWLQLPFHIRKGHFTFHSCCFKTVKKSYNIHEDMCHDNKKFCLQNTDSSMNDVLLKTLNVWFSRYSYDMKVLFACNASIVKNERFFEKKSQIIQKRNGRG